MGSADPERVSQQQSKCVLVLDWCGTNSCKLKRDACSVLFDVYYGFGEALGFRSLRAICPSWCREDRGDEFDIQSHRQCLQE
jgi:hypothetical protein